MYMCNIIKTTLQKKNSSESLQSNESYLNFTYLYFIHLYLSHRYIVHLWNVFEPITLVFLTNLLEASVYLAFKALLIFVKNWHQMTLPYVKETTVY